MTDRTNFLQQAIRPLGFTLADIDALLALQGETAIGCAELRDRASLRKNHLRAKINQLERIVAVLDAVTVACPTLDVGTVCSIISEIAGEAEREGQSDNAVG